MFTKEKFEELIKTAGFVSNLNVYVHEKEIETLRKRLNKEINIVKDFFANIKDERFSVDNVKITSEKDNVKFLIKNIKNDISQTNLSQDKKETLDSTKKYISFFNRYASNFADFGDLEKRKKSKFGLTAGKTLYFYFYDNQMQCMIQKKGHFLFAFKPSIDRNHKITEMYNYSVKREVFLNSIKNEVLKHLIQYSYDVQKTCENMYELQRVKNKLSKSSPAEIKGGILDLFKDYTFTYNESNKKDKIKEIQELIELKLDISGKRIRLNKLDNKN